VRQIKPAGVRQIKPAGVRQIKPAGVRRKYKPALIPPPA